MKRLFSILAIVGCMAFGTVNANAANAHTMLQYNNNAANPR